MPNEEFTYTERWRARPGGLGKGMGLPYQPDHARRRKGFLPHTTKARENKAQIAMFDAWDEALKAKGYHGRTVELTLAERGEVKLLADSIVAQSNREAIACEAIEYAQSNDPVAARASPNRMPIG